MLYHRLYSCEERPVGNVLLCVDYFIIYAPTHSTIHPLEVGVQSRASDDNKNGDSRGGCDDVNLKKEVTAAVCPCEREK